jgi:hypothetical protein
MARFLFTRTWRGCVVGGPQLSYLPACKTAETPRHTHILRNVIVGMWESAPSAPGATFR